MPIFETILGAALPPLISGIFGNKEEPRKTGINYVKLRRDAQKAGFNPLTALMAGGAAAYNRDTGPEMTRGSFIAEAISRGAETFFNQRQADKDRELENIEARERMRLQEESEMRLMAASSRQSFGYDLTQTVVPASNSHGGGPALDQEADLNENPPGAPMARWRNAPLYTASGQLRPMERPTATNRNRVPVYPPWGGTEPIYIQPNVAEENGLAPFDTASGQFMTTALGEGGEVYNIGNAQGVIDTQTGYNFLGGRGNRGPINPAPQDPIMIPPPFTGAATDRSERRPGINGYYEGGGGRSGGRWVWYY